MNTPLPPLSGLARRLVRDGLLAEDTAYQAVNAAAKAKTPLPQHLVTNKLVAANTLLYAAADEFGSALVDIDALNLTLIDKTLVDAKLVAKHRALPIFKRGNRLFIALADPTNLHALDEIKFQTGLNTEAILVEADKLERHVEQYLHVEEQPLEDSLGGLDAEALDGLDIEAVDENAAGGKDDTSEADEAPIVRFVNKVLLDAIKSGSSDIHFEPYEKAYRVRFRTDGILREVARPPTNLATRLAARLKVMSQMDISERRVPQDGRIKMKISKTRAIDFRVNTLPTLWGKKLYYEFWTLPAPN